MTDCSIDTTRDEGLLLIQLNRPEVRAARDGRRPAFRGQ